MTDQVQHLIDRIRKDAVATAETKAAAILQQARDEAREITAAAAARATALVAEAEQKAHALVERGQKSLEQAARDLLVGIGQRLQAMVLELLTVASADALRPEVIEEMLLRLSDGLARAGVDDKNVAVTIGKDGAEQITQFALGKLRGLLRNGMDVHVDEHFGKGFRLSFAGDTVRHDFTPAAIAAALSKFVVPQLGETIVRAANATAGPVPVASPVSTSGPGHGSSAGSASGKRPGKP